MNVYGHNLPFGLKNGRMVEVFEVEKGLACGCVCPSCFSPLQANKGEKRQYFSHDPKQRNENCESALETSIHKMAKQVLTECGYIKTPELTINEALESNFRVFEEQESIELEADITFESLAEEVSLEDIRPDVLAHLDGKPFIIEIAVTHFVDNEKKKKIRQLGVPAIEVDLSSLDRLPSKAELFEKVIEDTTNKKWISNPKAKGVRERLKQKLRSLADKALRSYMKLQIQRSQQTNLKPFKRSQQIKINPSSPHPAQTRWIRCEACLNVFQKTIEDAPLKAVTIECPECGFLASGALSDTGQLPTAM